MILKFFLVFFMVSYSSGASSFQNITNFSRIGTENGILEKGVFPSESEIEECKKDISKCQDFHNYPEELIKELINDGKIQFEWFHNEKDEIMNIDVHSNDPKVIEGPKSLCESNNTSLYPRGGITRDGKFIYIVQLTGEYSSYRQSIQTTGCYRKSNETNEEIACTVGGTNLRSKLTGKLLEFGYYCVEKFGFNNKLVGIDENKTILREVSIQEPIGCVCEYKEMKQPYSSK